MERDGFLSHGAAMISLDRLLKSSDTTYIPVCTLCGTTTGVEVLRSREQKQLHTWQCRFCPETTKGRKSASFRGQRSSSRGTCGGGYIVQIPISAAYKYLLAELSTCNIHVTFGVSDPPKGVCVSNWTRRCFEAFKAMNLWWRVLFSWRCTKTWICDENTKFTWCEWYNPSWFIEFWKFIGISNAQN